MRSNHSFNPEMTQDYTNASRLVSGFTRHGAETRAAHGRPGEVPWVRGAGDQTELKPPRLPSLTKNLSSNPCAEPRAVCPPGNRRNGNALYEQWAKSPSPKLMWLYPSLKSLLQCNLKTTSKTILKKWLRLAHKGVGSLRYRLCQGQTNTSNLNKKKARLKAILYKGDFFLPSAMLPQILARTICMWPNLPSPRHCQRRDKSIRWVGQ